MTYRLLADLTVGLHLLFILYVLGGGLLIWRSRRFAIPHLTCVAWGVYIELVPDTVCPLTPLENHLLRRAGESGYSDGFVEHYLLPILYPANLTSEVQWVLAGLVVLVNTLVYGLAWSRRRRRLPGRSGESE
jgi:Protein of Unknown function (DUF2784)